MPDIEAYFNFVLTMFLAFGVTFEIPIVVILLVRMGVVTIDKLKEARPYVIVGAFVVAAVVTPARRALAVHARRADVHPLRGRPVPRPLRRHAQGRSQRRAALGGLSRASLRLE